MKSDINKTFNVLGSYMKSNNHLNIGYLSDMVSLFGFNTEIYYSLINSRMKNRNIALCWLKGLIDTELKYAGYRNYYCTNYHLKRFDYEHSNDITRVLDIVEQDITDYRQELKEQKGSK